MKGRSEPAAELPISDARDSLTDVVSRAHYAGRISYVTRRGRRLAAIVPADLAEAIERAEDAADVAAARNINPGDSFRRADCALAAPCDSPSNATS